jgi:hypothetical protein
LGCCDQQGIDRNALGIVLAISRAPRRTLQFGREEGFPFRSRALHAYVASERNPASSFVEAAHRDFLSCQTSAGFQQRSCAATARLFAPSPELVVFRLQAGRCVAQRREVGPTFYAPYPERAGSFLRRWPPHAGSPRRLSFQRSLRNRCHLAETRARLMLALDCSWIHPICYCDIVVGKRQREQCSNRLPTLERRQITERI